MPTRETVGTSGAANKAIGGVPTLHYFDFASRGRGQTVRLLWEDAGIAYTDVRYSFDEYPSYKKSIISELNPTSNVPVVELNGKVLTQSYAILRYFARQLGKYDGANDDEKYWADAMCDIAIDWRTLFVQAFFSEDRERTYAVHQDTARNHYLKAMETHLSTSQISIRGPFVVGNTFTYSDIVLYQILHDENLTQEGRKGLKGYQRLIKLVDAVEQRPNITAFLQSKRYRG
ncbi:MAG: hypothetical protein Q9191_000067 [Dirinaria sp. TL-2023a]